MEDEYLDSMWEDQYELPYEPDYETWEKDQLAQDQEGRDDYEEDLDDYEDMLDALDEAYPD